MKALVGVALAATLSGERHKIKRGRASEEQRARISAEELGERDSG